MIKPLTSLRFFFAFMVFVSHLWFIKDDGVAATQLYEHIFSEGYIGVSFFFILSGFILSYNYKNKILEGQISKRSFWIARFARVYPLHFITLMIAIPLSFRHNMVEWITRFLLNLFLLQSFVPTEDIYFYFNSVSWSISDEMFFYLAFPFLLSLLFYKRNIKFAIVLSLLIPIGLFMVKSNYHQNYFYINPLLRVADFSIGIMLFSFYEMRKAVEFSSRRWASIAEVAVIGLLLLFFLFHEYIPQGFRYSCYYWPPMIGIIYVFAYSKGRVSDILSNAKLVYLGEISFGFYMWHMLVIRYFNYVGGKIPLVGTLVSHHATEIIMVFTTSLTVSHITYKFIETPFNKYIKKRLISKKLPAVRTNV